MGDRIIKEILLFLISVDFEHTKYREKVSHLGITGYNVRDLSLHSRLLARARSSITRRDADRKSVV